MQGVVAGLLGCLFGTIGIFALALVFVPLAALCTLVGLLRSLFGRSLAGFGASMLAGVVTIIAFITSPSLLLLFGGLVAAFALSGANAPSDMRVARVSPSTPVPAPQVQTPAPTPRSPNPAPQVRPVVQPGSGFRSGETGPMAAVQAEAKAGILQCRNRRLSGEFLKYTESTDCSNALVISTYRRAGYRYMDLVTAWTSKRREVAEALDSYRLNEFQANALVARSAADLANVEWRRDAQR